MFELKVVKVVAAVHRGAVNLAIRSISARRTRAAQRYNDAMEYASNLAIHANNTLVHAEQVREVAHEQLRDTQIKINAAENLVLNARDDLAKFTNHA